jgi:hypothetical protein
MTDMTAYVYHQTLEARRKRSSNSGEICPYGRNPMFDKT